MENVPTDEDVARAVQLGDTEAFGVLMRRYEAKLLRYAARLLGDRDRGEEVVQETFIQAYRNIHAYSTSRAFSPWMYRIAHNKAIDEIRRTSRAPLQIDLDTFAVFAAEESASSDTEREETKEMIDRGLKDLSPQYREILLLFYVEELEYKAIADVLRVPISTVGVRLRRARQALKNAIGPVYA